MWNGSAPRPHALCAEQAAKRQSGTPGTEVPVCRASEGFAVQDVHVQFYGARGKPQAGSEAGQPVSKADLYARRDWSDRPAPLKGHVDETTCPKSSEPSGCPKRIHRDVRSFFKKNGG